MVKGNGLSVCLLMLLWQTGDINVTANISTSEITASSQMNFHIVVTYMAKNDSLKVPLNLWFGYEEDTSADLYCILERKNVDSTYKPVEPYADYDQIDVPRRTFRFLKNDSVTYDINLNYLYPFSKGNYRVKFIYRPKNFNELLTTNSSSNWISFDVLKDVSIGN